MVRLWIEDHGIGVDAAAHLMIFDIFQRLHSSSQYEGTGIGLAIVRKAVERMGGRVGVKSEHGKGSRFWLEFPRG
jgi:signal transduction histidine kinase